MTEPTYVYRKGEGWVVSVQKPRPQTWVEACARICKNCERDFGSHCGWSCDVSPSEWPSEDRWEMENGKSPFRPSSYK